eukprot:COSAG01_NODE_713_length_14097_cov_15.136448_3_plen_84_part_00
MKKKQTKFQDVSVSKSNKEEIKPYLRCLFRALMGMLFSIIAFGGMGVYLGNIFDALFVCLIGGLVVGLSFGFYLMYIEIKKLS